MYARSKLPTAEADLLVVQEARCTAAELEALAMQQPCQVVYRSEVGGTVLVAAFAWKGALQRIEKCPSGTVHHFRWQVVGQYMFVRSGYLPRATRREKDHLALVLAEWLDAAEGSSEPTMIVGDFNATRDELDISRWLEAAGWYELGDMQQPATAEQRAAAAAGLAAG